MSTDLLLPRHTFGFEEVRLLDLYLSLNPIERAERFAGTAKAAQLTGVTRRAVQQWVAAGAIRAVLVGKSYRIDLVSLRGFLQERACTWADR